MSKKMFIETKACQMNNTTHLMGRCATCRDTSKYGIRWRRNLQKLYKLPNNDTDFECPWGLKWGYKDGGLGDIVAKALKLPGISRVVKAVTGINTHKPCGGCRKRQVWLNKHVPL